MPKHHDLKSVPEKFDPLLKRRVHFDVRRDDRHFEIGDAVTLREYRAQVGEFTGRSADLVIVAIERPSSVRECGVKDGWCVLEYGDPR